jgi:hypothetical protein
MTAAALRVRFLRAKSMSVSAEKYYGKLRCGVPPVEVAKWDRAIEAAERARLGDAKGQMMDILLAKTPDATQEISHPNRVANRGPAEEWIQLGLDIEQRQCVYTYPLTLAERLCPCATGCPFSVG